MLPLKYDAAVPTKHWYLLTCFTNTTAIWRNHHQLIAHSVTHTKPMCITWGR